MELTNEFVVPVPVDQAWAVLTDIEKIAPCMPGAELKEVEGDEYRGVVKVKVGPITASYRGAASFSELDAANHRAVLKAEGRETRGQGNATATITATLVPEGDGTKVEVLTDLAITGKVAQFGRGVLAEVSGKLLDQFVHNLETTVLSPGGGAEGAAAAGADDVEGAAVAGAAATAAGDSAPAAAAESAAADRAATGKAAANGKGAAGKSAGGGAAAAAGGGTAGGGTAGGGAAAAAGGGTAAEGAAVSEAASAEEPAAAPASGPRKIDSPPAEPVDLVGVAGASLGKRLIPFASIAGALFLIRIVVYALRRRKH
jgi:hypothetical protein